MKKLYLLVITAFSALRAGKVFAADNISVIASCREDADIITGAKWYGINGRVSHHPAE